MHLSEAIEKRRSIRKFKQDNVSEQVLIRLIETARLAPSAANLQPLEYLVVNDKKHCQEIFNTLSWAGYIKPHGNPEAGEEPTAYIIVLANTNIRSDYYKYDVGAAVENILLSALNEGLGSCWIGTVDRESIRKTFHLPGHLVIDSVIALGYPSEAPVVEEAQDSIKYWKDDQANMHVPKRKMTDICHLIRETDNSI